MKVAILFKALYHLYRDFKRKGILAFKEDDHVRRGEERSPQVFRAIEQSTFLVAIFSDGFASLPSCPVRSPISHTFEDAPAHTVIHNQTIIVVVVPKFIGEGYTMSTIRVEYEWASPRGHVLDECSKKIDLDVLLNLKKPTQAIRGIPVGSKPKSTFIYRPVQSTKKTDKAPAKPKDNCGCMNSASTQEPEQVEGSGKKDINTSVPSRSCYKTPISVVSSIHGSSPVASDSYNSIPLAEKINKNGKLMLDGKLILVDDDGKPLNKVDSAPIDSDSVKVRLKWLTMK
ncbi:NB-ARC domains-containing protein [Tanacetum coccineum]|uniref:NB-ARC domains-containing protein n=1 Tax=Tanacetum coccineum TaxID=301880 RepID=A0ABQ5FVH8_9ASTR